MTKFEEKFEEKLTCVLKNNMRNLANFQQSTLMNFFFPKQKMHELEIYGGNMCNDTEK